MHARALLASVAKMPMHEAETLLHACHRRIAHLMCTGAETPIRHELIATAAYFRWIAAGSPPGRDLEFWLLGEADQEAQPCPLSPLPQ